MSSVVKSHISKNPGKIRKNRNFQLTKISAAKKANSQRFECEKNQTSHHLQESPHQKKTRKNPLFPPHFKIAKFFSGEKRKENYNLPPQWGGWRMDGEWSEFSPCRALPSHQSSKWEQKMDAAMGGDPRGGPLFPPTEKGQKTSRKTPCEPKQKTFLQILNQQKNSFFSDSFLRTKIENFNKKFNAIFHRKSKRMEKTFFQVPKIETKIFSEKNFFRILKKNSKKVLTFSFTIS